MSPSQRQSVAQISQALGIHVATLHHWRLSWRLKGEVVPASGKDSEGWIATDQFTLMLETAGFNATELCAYCRERCLCQATLKTVVPIQGSRQPTVNFGSAEPLTTA
jgi:hypothetical protein